MGNTAGQGNTAYDGDAAPGSAAAQPPVIPGLRPETQELLAARYGASGSQVGRPAGRYGRQPAVRYPVKAFVRGWLAAYGTLVALALVATVVTTVMTLRPAAGPTTGAAPSLPEAVGSSLMLLVYVPLFAAFPALFIGVPAALGVVFALRNVRNQ